MSGHIHKAGIQLANVHLMCSVIWRPHVLRGRWKRLRNMAHHDAARLRTKTAPAAPHCLNGKRQATRAVTARDLRRQAADNHGMACTAPVPFQTPDATTRINAKTNSEASCCMAAQASCQRAPKPNLKQPDCLNFLRKSPDPLKQLLFKV